MNQLVFSLLQHIVKIVCDMGYLILFTHLSFDITGTSVLIKVCKKQTPKKVYLYINSIVNFLVGHLVALAS